MQFDDKKIGIIAQSICSKTKVPELTFDMPCSQKRKVINKAYLLVAIIFTAICLLGFTIITYYFSSDNQAFKTIQDSGFVSVVNKKNKNDDVTLTVQAIVTDGLKSYVRIEIDGVERLKINHLNHGIEDYIEDAFFCFDNTMCGFKNQLIYQDNEMEMYQESPTMLAENLKNNEAILIFNEAPTENTKVTLRFKLKNISSEFLIKDIPINVPPVVKRNVSDLNLEFTLPYGTGKINEITHTILETHFDISWTLKPDFLENLPYFNIQNKAEYVNGKNTIKYLLPQPNRFNDDGILVENQFVVYGCLDPNEDIIINAYKDNYSTFASELITIPGMHLEN